MIDEQPVLQRRKFFQGRKIRGAKDITWLEPSGKEMSDEAWDANWQQCLGVRLAGDMIPEVDERGQKIAGDTLLSLFNAHHEMIPFTLPVLPDDQQWQLLLDTTSAANDNLFLAGGASYPLQGRSVAVLRHHGVAPPASRDSRPAPRTRRPSRPTTIAAASPDPFWWRLTGARTSGWTQR